MSAIPSHHPILWPPGKQQTANSKLKVFVLYTGVRRTLAAIRRASEMAAGLNARIEVIIPHVVPYPLPIEEPAVTPSFLSNRFKALLENGEIEASIHVYLCRDQREAVASAIPAQSIVVIGTRRWWPTREHPLGRWLRDNGHRVLFVDTRSYTQEIFRA
jgi:hypothetical protein